jgi:hypothetical protein
MAIFAVSFLSQLAAGKSAARDDKGKGDARWKVVAGRRDIVVACFLSSPFLSPGFRDPGVNIL